MAIFHCYVSSPEGINETTHTSRLSPSQTAGLLPRGASKRSPQGIAAPRSALLGTRESSNLVLFSPSRAKEIIHFWFKATTTQKVQKLSSWMMQKSIFCQVGPHRNGTKNRKQRMRMCIVLALWTLPNLSVKLGPRWCGRIAMAISILPAIFLVFIVAIVCHVVSWCLSRSRSKKFRPALHPKMVLLPSSTPLKRTIKRMVSKIYDPPWN